MDNMSIDDRIKKYEELQDKADKVKNDVQRESIELEYDKKNIKEKMDLLKSKGIEFGNLTELESELGNLLNELDGVITSTERKLSELN